MRELWGSFLNSYDDYRGTGKLLALFLVSVLIIYLINVSEVKIGYDKGSKENRTETINPLLFILSPIAGIGYAFTLVYERYLISSDPGNKSLKAGRCLKYRRLLMGLLILLTLTLSGRFVFMQTGAGRLISYILIPVYLAAYIPLSFKLFPEGNLKWFMILCILVLNLWGYQSEAMLPVMMFGGRISLPAVIVHAVLPLVLWVALDRYCKYMERALLAYITDGDELDYYKWEEEDMKNHKIINSRNLAIALLIVVIMLLGSVFVMNRKINNLYQTTVNLQEQVEELKHE